MIKVLVLDVLGVLIARDSLFVVKDDFLAELDRLKAKGVKITLLSNSRKESMVGSSQNLRDLMDGYVDKTFFASETNTFKPSSGALKNIIDAFGVSPDECFVIDDDIDNTAAAKRFGCKVHTYITSDVCMKEIKKI